MIYKWRAMHKGKELINPLFSKKECEKRAVARCTEHPSKYRVEDIAIEKVETRSPWVYYNGR